MERIVEIEKSIIKSYRSKLWSPFIKAIKEYQLLQEHDHVCVCISGGKDSMLMAKLFQELKRHSDFEFEVSYLVMNPGYNEENLQIIKNNLELLQIPAKIVDTDIFDITASVDRNPCYLCARMRRGALYNIASSMGCNKIALGHHMDDVIETTLMSILNNGALETMLPKLHSQNYQGMEIIRPLYLIREKNIIAWKNRNNLKFIQCACRFTENCSVEEAGSDSQRYATKQLIKQLEKENPVIVKNLFKVTSNVNLDKVLGWRKDGVLYNYLDTYDENKIIKE